jgi:hypothetical protein
MFFGESLPFWTKVALELSKGNLCPIDVSSSCGWIDRVDRPLEYGGVVRRRDVEQLL